MKVAVLPCALGDVLDHVLVLDQAVGHRDQRVELHVDLALAGGRHLVVVALDDQADLGITSAISERMSCSVSDGGTGK